MNGAGEAPLRARPSFSWTSPAQKRRVARSMDLVEERLATIAGEYPGQLGEACRATLSAGGKRVRPLLTLLCARRGAAPAENVLRAAVSVELLHMATLVHDDVLDRAELRRGKPTVVHRYGPATAVSTGNYLLARSFSELVGAGCPEAVDLLSATAVGLSEGEVLQRAEANDVTIVVEQYVRRCERKTADLFAAACGLGALLSGAGDETVGAVGSFGRLIGLAFQVLDDILDCSGDQAATGKRPGTDVRDGTITLPMIHALEARPELSEILRRPGPSDADVDVVLLAVEETGALKRARADALRYIEEARAVLAACPDTVERGLLVQVAEQVVDRYS
ncbi:MAG TPA: polyprenyl synthetase family protein [Thermoleophilia bacterium]|nr:polyprenyl synthetase family protein [Thermoleophilia bacterium]